MTGALLSDQEFLQFQQLLQRVAGIHLAPTKKPLLCGRLAKRLRHLKLDSFGDYYSLITSGSLPGEMEIALNLLTTNETYFFREPQHFDFLRDLASRRQVAAGPMRVWSAACSTGEETYSIAMVLADALGTGAQWEVLGSDINTEVLSRAAAGHYAMERARHIPKDDLRRHCLKGVGSRAGSLLVDHALRRHVRFAQVNLCQDLPALGCFDVIFLRNALIYFELEVKRQVVERALEHLRPGGWFLVGHSETMNGVSTRLRCHSPTIYAKAD